LDSLFLEINPWPSPLWTTPPPPNTPQPKIDHKRTRGVSHFGLAIYIKKYLKAKEELWKLKYFTMQK
jgi:hypothetical protein